MQKGPKADVDLNNVTMRMAMDVTGIVGFAKDFKTTEALDDPATDETFETLKAGICAHSTVHALLAAAMACTCHNVLSTSVHHEEMQRFDNLCTD